jgi:hypothetical protein
VTEPSARQWWLALEPVHAVVYFDEGCRASMSDIGLRGFWMGYFAGRAAPLGPVGPEVVAAMFFNFHPDMVSRALPDAWELTEPARVWAARRAGAAEALRRVAPDVDRWAETAVPLLERAVSAAPGAGRPLFDATRATGWPSDPVEALWHGCTCLREHRGDGHVAALTASGLDGAETLVLFATSEGLSAEMFQTARGWSEDQWMEAGDRLRARGLLDGAGISPDGVRLRRSIEAMTDQQAERPLAALDARQLQQLLDAVGPVTAAVHASGVIAYPNPMGLPAPRP